MDLWRGPLPRFVELARSGSIAAEMVGAFYARHGSTPGTSEIRSWEHSLTALAEVLRDSRLADSAMSVRAAGWASGAGTASGPGESKDLAAEADDVAAVSAEYHLPLDNRRIDVLLFGHDEGSRAHALALELKQWSACAVEDEHALNVLVGGHEHVHPSQQALDYAGWLGDYHSAFTDGGVVACSAAWCHELAAADAGPLRGAAFGGLLERSPLFVAGEEGGLVQALARRVGAGGGMDVLGRVAGGRFRPSDQVVEALEAVLRAERAWHLLDEQRAACDAILADCACPASRRLARRLACPHEEHRGSSADGDAPLWLHTESLIDGRSMLPRSMTDKSAATQALRSCGNDGAWGHGSR
jgi:hypothetical protein